MDRSGKGGSALVIKENTKHHENDKRDAPEIQAKIVTVQMKPKDTTVDVIIPVRKSPKEEQFTRPV